MSRKKSSFPLQHCLSVWEEMDYEWSYFQQIFTVKQFATYEQHYSDRIEQYKRALVESDRQHQKELKYQEERHHFIINKFLSMWTSREMMLFSVWLRDEPTKYAFLKAEYRRFLNNYKAEIITGHFRHYKTYQPILLKASLLRHQIQSIWPDYEHFKAKMDEPTKAVAGHLEEKVKRVPDEIVQFAEQTVRRLYNFQTKLFKKYYGDEGGWHVVIDNKNEQEQITSLIMSVLLLELQKNDNGWRDKA